MLRPYLTPALLLGTALAAGGACSSVIVTPETSAGTTSGSGAGGGQSATGGQGGGGGSAGGSGGGGGAAPVDLPWQVTVTGDVNSVEVVAGAAGSAIVAGSFTGTLDLGGGPFTSTKWGDLFVAKFDAAGHHVWSRSFAGAGSPPGLAVDGLGDVLLTGSFREVTDFGGGPLQSAGHADVFVAKLDASGHHVYSRAFGDSETQVGNAVATDAAGNAYVAGTFTGTMDFGGGPLDSPEDRDIFVVALDPSGNHLWSRRFGGEGDQSADRIAASAGGGLVVTGPYLGATDLGGGPLPESPSSLLTTSFVLELDPAGHHVSSKGYNCRQAAPAFDSAGSLALATAFTGDVDFGAGPLSSGYFIHVAAARFAPSQQVVWNQAFGDVGATVYDVSISPAAAGALLLVGHASGGLDFGGGQLLGGTHQGGFLAEIDSAGAHVWSRGFGGEGDFQDTRAAVAPDGDVFFAGTFVGTVELPEGAVTSQGKRDFFLVKLVP